MSKRKQTEEIPSKIKGMRRHNRSNGRAINRENVALRDGKWKVASPEGAPHPILQRISTKLSETNKIHRGKTNKWESLSMRG